MIPTIVFRDSSSSLGLGASIRGALKIKPSVFTLHKARTKFLVVTDSIRKDTLTQPFSNDRHDRNPRLLERLLRAVINLCPVTRRGVR